MVKNSGVSQTTGGLPCRVWVCVAAMCLAVLLCAPMPALAQGNTSGPSVQSALCIEQAQAELPLLRAWVYAEAPPGGDEVMLTLGGQPLETLEVRPADPAKDSTSWYFLVDCSTSTTAAQMEAIRDVLDEFAGHMGKNDTVSLISFGTQVDTLLRQESEPAALAAAAQTLAPNQPGTLFFDALAACVELSGQGEPLRREVAFVFSDSVDYNLGGYTKAEVDALLAGGSLPVYAFGFDTGGKDELDNFGALARSSGGAISVVDAQSLPGAFAAQLERIQSALFIEARTRNNIIAAPVQTLEVTTGAATAEAQVAVRHWTPDTEAPRVIAAQQVSDESIRLAFSEPVTGAENPASYEIIRENGDLAGVSAAAYSETDNTVLLTLSPLPPGGPLRILCPGVRDVSMEQNAVTGETILEFEAKTLSVSTTQEDAPFALWLLLTLAGVAVIAAIALAVVKKRGGFVVKGDKLHFADAAVVERELANAPGAQVRFVQSKHPVPEITLQVSAGGAAGRTVRVPLDKTLFVGRGDVCDLVFDDPSMSRQHFVLSEENGVYTISNLSETVGTRLNGVAVQKPRPLQTGDVIEAGNTKLIFSARERPASPAPATAPPQ